MIAGFDVRRFGGLSREYSASIDCFFDGNDFEDVIRNAIGIGGDSDTIGAMAGDVEEECYGVSVELKEKALGYLDNFQKYIYYAFEKIHKPRIIR